MNSNLQSREEIERKKKKQGYVSYGREETKALQKH